MGKKLLFSSLTVLGFFLLLEGVLALSGVEPVSRGEDPFVGFASTLPLFEEVVDPENGIFLETSPAKRLLFNQQRFRKRKAEGVYRIFSVGGSTTFGHPYDDTFSFSGWLREFLPAADPSRQWEVINAGGISYASYRVAKLMDELARYEPDLFVVYTGHNEFLERRSYQGLMDAPAAVTALGGLAGRTRVYAAGRRLLAGGGEAADVTELPAEVDAMLDRSVGPVDYHRDDAFRDQVVEHFGYNLRRMVEIARGAGADIVFINPASNLKDCSPFKSEHSPDLSAEQRGRLDHLLAAAEAAGRELGWEETLHYLDEAAKIDPRFAETHYRRGTALYELGRFPEAKVALDLAIEEDVCPLRAIEPLRRAIVEVAGERDVAVVDFAARMAEVSANGITAAEYFPDHIHLTLEGYRLLSLDLLKLLVQTDVAKLGADWDQDKLEDLSRLHEAQLDRHAHGLAMRNLARVFAWAGKLEEAGRLAQQAIDELGEDAESLTILGRSFNARGDYNSAHGSFQRGLEVDPLFGPAHAELGALQLKAGKADEAIPHLEAALRFSPGNEELQSNLALAVAEGGDIELAIRRLERAVERRPDSAEARSNLGLQLSRRGRTHKAIEQLRLAVNLNPRHAEALNNLGLALTSAGEFDEAIDRLGAAAKLRPGSPQIHYNLGTALYMESRLPEAIGEYEQALQLEPRYVEAHHNLGVALQASGRGTEAKAHFREALAINPDFRMARQQLGSE